MCPVSALDFDKTIILSLTWRSPLAHPNQTAIAPITKQLFAFAAGSILKGIANNFSELINEANHFRALNFGEKQTILAGI